MKKVTIIAGPSGSGKSWVLDRARGYEVVEHDKHNREYLDFHIGMMNPGENILVDCPFAVSVLADRLRSRNMKVKIVYIVESPQTIISRLSTRNNYYPKRDRTDYMNRRAKEQADFSGTSQEVLDYLNDPSK